MFIPSGRGLTGFVCDVANQCFSSRADRINRGVFYQNYFMSGSSDQSNAAMYNKIYALLDETESLLYSPVSLKFKITDPDTPSVVNVAKNRAAAQRMRNLARKSETDTMVSAAVCAALVKGKGLIKQMWKRGGFSPALVEPEDFGVMRENHDRLDEDMEAFSHSMMITPYQFARLVHGAPDREQLMEKAKTYTQQSTGLPSSQNVSHQIVVGGLYPFQPAGVAPTGARGVVDWMSQPQPQLAPEVMQSLMELRETWIWDDDREDWSTFQTIGDDLMIMGRYQKINALAYDARSRQSNECLKGMHPFREFCSNPIPGYYWGRSEMSHIIGLQEALNSRQIGIQNMLRRQENPTTRFIGSTGVNQVALSRYQKPGGYWVDSNPQAKVETDTPQIPQDLWASTREYERMMDEQAGVPPTARGKNEAGVRSAEHANTLVRQFSPRFKDRALLVERDVEALGGLMLDMCRAHDDTELIAWVAPDAAGFEKPPIPDPLIVPPAKGLVPVKFRFADLPEEVSLLVDSHSSSPAFIHDAMDLDFALVKIGAMSPADFVEHVDAPNPEELRADMERRAIAQAENQQKMEQLKLMSGGKK